MTENELPPNMKPCGEFESIDFSLLGGPLHRLGCQLGLTRGRTNTVWLGVAIGAFLWVVVLLLALIEGVGGQVFSTAAIGAHVRLLVAIPLFFLCETWLDPELTAFVRGIVRNGVIPEAGLPTLNMEIARTTRLKDAWLPEAVFLLASILLSVLAPKFYLTAVTAAHAASPTAGDMTLTGEWYWFVCLTLFRFLILRWIWRLGLWTRFLWRLSRLKPHLVPTNPDRTAGLGYLDVVHTQFIPLVLAISALESGSLAEDIFAGRLTLEGVPLEFVFIFVADAALFLAPLCIFVPMLWLCRVNGLRDYGALATRYVSDFEKKWLGADAAAHETLLGTPDLQSLADLSNSVNVVRNMRLIPVSRQTLVAFAVAALAPMLPLLLLSYSVDMLAKNLFKTLLGLP